METNSITEEELENLTEDEYKQANPSPNLTAFFNWLYDSKKYTKEEKAIILDSLYSFFGG